jgi:hypothetical protein
MMSLYGVYENLGMKSALMDLADYVAGVIPEGVLHSCSLEGVVSFLETNSKQHVR